MKSEGIRIRPIGGMDSDSDYLNIREGNYTVAKNIRHITRDGQTMFSVENVVGNEQIVTLPAVSPSQKQFEIYIDQEALTSGTETFAFLIYTSNGAAFPSFTFDVDSAGIATSIANLVAAFAAAMITFGFTATTANGTYNATSGYFIFSINTLGYSDYNVFIEIATTGAVSTVKKYVISESIPPNLALPLRPIAFRSLKNDMFVLLTTQDKEPTTLAVNITAATNATPIVLTLSGAHGLITGTKVYIKGVNGNTGANGVFTVTNTAVNQLTLDSSVGTGVFSASPDASLQYNIEGVSQIGVITYNDHTEVFSYTALLTTKKLNLVSTRMPVLRTEDNVNRKSLYFVDGYNLMRCFYYKGNYIPDGAIFHPVNNPSGFYNYDTLGIETQLLLSNINIDASVTEVRQSGGSLPAGNIIYWIQFINDGGTTTDFIGPYGPVNIYKEPYDNIDEDSDARKILGDKELEPTPKAVVLRIENIPNAFQYLQVSYGVLSGLGTFTKSGTLPRELINERVDIEIIHTGTELETEFVPGSVSVRSPNYSTAEHIDLLDNTAIISNVGLSKTYDFSDWFATFKYSLKYYKMESMLSEDPLTPDGLRIREYMLETNVLNYRGYMLKERYRFYGVGEFYNGSYTSPFFIEDITFDTTAVGGKRTQTLPDLSLGGYTGTDNYHYIPYVEFHSFDKEFLVDGIPVGQILKRVHIYRCEVDNKQVLASGIMVPCISGGTVVPFNLGWSYYDGSSFFQIGEWPYVYLNGAGPPPPYGIRNYDGPYLGYPDANAANIGLYTPQRRYVGFYSSDIRFRQVSFDVLPGDKIINLGQGSIPRAANNSGNYYVYMRHEDYYTANYPASELTIDDGKYLEQGTSTIVNGVPVSKQVQNGFDRPEGHILHLTTDAVRLSAAPVDYAVYNAMYYRPITAKAQYGDTFASKCIPTGAVYDLEKSSVNILPDVVGTYTPGVFQVFGGDTFTHTAFTKLFYCPDTSVINDYYNTCVIHTTQSRINYSMRRIDDNGSTPYPKLANILTFLKTRFSDTTDYNKSYSLEKAFAVMQLAAFDPNLDYKTKEPGMIAWSGKKQIGSQLDAYRYFAPLDFVLMDYSNGAINGQRVANGSLFTWQDSVFKKHYFNSDGMFVTQDGTEVILGSGKKMGRRESDISVFGCENKWSIIVGRSPGGNDVLYWMNARHKKVVRFGADGTVVIADLHMQDFQFRDGLTWAVLADNPVLFNGIMGIWNQRYGEAIWNVVAKRSVDAYNPATNYSSGTAVQYVNAGVYYGVIPLGEIYISKVGGNTGNTPPAPGTSDAFWEWVPHTNTDYYSEFSIVFNEKNNKFTNFRTLITGLMGEWRDTYMVSRPNPDDSVIDIDDKGLDLTWHGGAVVEDGFLEAVVNKYPDVTKKFQAIMIRSKITPYRVEFRTENHYSYLVAADFEEIEEGYWSPIKNDATVTLDNPGGLNTLDTSPLWGRYIRVKVFFQAGVRQVVNHIVIKVQLQHRTVDQ